MGNRPYTMPRPRQHNAHVWAFVRYRRVMGALDTKQVKSAHERMRKTTREAYTSGGRALGRFGKW